MLNPNKIHCCAQCNWLIEFGSIHYCKQLRKLFQFEMLFWELTCSKFSQVIWPLPINQLWRNLKIPQRRATFVENQFKSFSQLLRKRLR